MKLNFKPIVLVVLLLIFLFACSSMRTVNPDTPDAIDNYIVAGDKIRVETNDGEEIQLQVVEVTKDGIIGKGQSIPRNNIKTIKKMDSDVIKSVGLGWGIAFAVVMLSFGSL